MTRTTATKVENNFSLGLVTETTLLKYPVNSCTETYDCIFDSIGNVTRRKGVDIEDFGTFYQEFSVSNQNYTEFVWTSVGGDGDRSFLVIQKGSNLHFYDVSSTSVSTSPLKKSFIYDLNLSLPYISPLNAKDFQCSFTNGRGRLVVTNRAIDPVYLEYDKSTDSFSYVIIPVQFRDFEGLKSEHSVFVDSRPIASVASARISLPNHLYNLYNQGWNLTDALTQWDSSRTDLPSNADSTSLYRLSEIDAFDPTKVGPKSPGNSYSPKGHFILTVGQEEREQVSGVFLGSSDVKISNTLFTGFDLIGSFSGLNYNTFSNLSNITNNVTFATDAASATASFVSTAGAGSSSHNATLGIRKSSGSKINRVRLYPSSNLGFASTSSANTLSNITFTLYGKTSIPSSPTDGIVLASVSSATDINSFIDIVSNDNTSLFTNLWINLTVTYSVGDLSSQTHKMHIAEMEVYEPGSFSFNRPEVTSFFAGRTWFAANSYSDKGTNIYFSQVIQRPEQLGQCYQKNDPTSEQFFDLLPDDGGSISIPEIANVVALFPMRSAMVVLATNGTWVIRGSSSEGFSATSFRVEKVSGVGCVSRTSVTDVKGIPQWAGEDSFYTIEYDPNYNAFQQKSLSDERIRSFYQLIPANNRRFIKGTYDTTEQIVRFIYNDNAVFTQADYYKYNKQLNYDINTKAWYPWTLPIAPNEIRGIINVVDSNHIYEARVKYIFTLETGGISFLSFAEQIRLNFTDWYQYSISVSGNPLDAKDYESFFVTAPMIEGQTQRFAQANYLYVFLDSETGSSCFVSPRFDWTNSGSSGKWGTIQQAYGTALNNRNVTVRRLKIRGKGRSIQFKFGSSPKKPFSILGWSIFETINAGV